MWERKHASYLPTYLPTCCFRPSCLPCRIPLPLPSLLSTSYSSSKMQFKCKFHRKFLLNFPRQKQLLLLWDLGILCSVRMFMGFSYKERKPRSMSSPQFPILCVSVSISTESPCCRSYVHCLGLSEHNTYRTEDKGPELGGNFDSALRACAQRGESRAALFQLLRSGLWEGTSRS